MIKVGLLGGAFNPPTIGHIKMAEHVLANTDMDEIWLTPCYDHLYGKNLESAKHRLDMCVLAIGNRPHIHAFDYEIRHQMDGSTYTFAEKLLNDPQLDADISFIIGQDNANGFHNFKNANELRKLAKFIVVGRGGVLPSEGEQWYHENPHTYLPWPNQKPCSSTMVREHLDKNGYESCPFLEISVFNYIKKNRLYPNAAFLKKMKEEKEKALKALNRLYRRDIAKAVINGLRK